MTELGDNSIAQIRSIVERIEKQEDEKSLIAEGIKDIYTEAKSNGFDVRALRRIIALRKMDPSKREEQEAILETYLHAMGML